jgi:antitoxin MazE
MVTLKNEKRLDKLRFGSGPRDVAKSSCRDYNVITEVFLDMRTELIRIGNSRGIRIPKPLIEQCGFGETVEVRVESDCLVISPERRPRQGWDDAFRASGHAAQDELMLETTESNAFDREEWRW